MKLVYFMRPVGERGPIKIGCSKIPEHRLRSLEIWSPLKLEIIASAPGSHREESILHRMFIDQRRHGEWFEVTPDLEALIAQVKATGELPELDPSLAPYVCKSPGMTKRINPVTHRNKHSLTSKMNKAERRVYGYLGAEFMRPAEIQAIYESYQGFDTPGPTDEQIAAISDYIAKLAELPPADKSQAAWDGWHRLRIVTAA